MIFFFNLELKFPKSPREREKFDTSCCCNVISFYNAINFWELKKLQLPQIVTENPLKPLACKLGQFGGGCKCKNDVTEHLFSLYPLSKGQNYIQPRNAFFQRVTLHVAPSPPSSRSKQRPRRFYQTSFPPISIVQPRLDQPRTKHQTKSSINVL